MATLRELKTRIGSVSSSEKITGAMKMISSAKVHKNEQALRRLLPYKNQIRSVMGHLVGTDANFYSPLMEEREVKRVGVVVFGSDDGLCGAYNINIFKALMLFIDKLQQQNPDARIEVIPVGKKMTKAVRRTPLANVEVNEPQGVDSKMEAGAVNEFTHTLRRRFLDGELDKVCVVYMQFHSMSRQRPAMDQLFPVDAEAVKGEATDVPAKPENELYLFEPDANTIFSAVLPMFVLSTMQEITIENRASEQAARVMAMQSANDNAHKLLDSLRLEYNKLRQQSITTELLDILGGQVDR